MFPGHTMAWPVEDSAAIDDQAMRPVMVFRPATEIVIIGCGALFEPPPPRLGEALRQAGLAMEWMDTGAACRTFNLLLTDDRRVAAALIPVL